jgi:phospholipase/carboxylesterase
MPRNNHLSVIALHGIALSEQEVDATVEALLKRVGHPEVRWIFPRAPRRDVTILGGPAMAWYDVRTFGRSQMDEDGIEEATSRICDLVRAERESGRFDRKVVLMGFSQGGAVALNAGLRLGGDVDGIVAISAALPFPERIAKTDSTPPVFLSHGLLDRTIPYTFGQETKRVLEEKGYEIEWHSYLCGHTIPGRQLYCLSRWLKRHFMPSDPMRTLQPRRVGGTFRATS